MGNINGIKAAHMGRVNSIFVSFKAGIVIGLDDESIRIWDSVKGVELYVADLNNSDDSVIPGLGSIYQTVH